MAHPYWPPFDLVVRTPRLELRLPSEAELTELAALAGRGVHDPSWQPFSTPWTDLGSPERERSVMQWAWRCIGGWTPQAWHYDPVTIVDGVVVGTQGVAADGFADLRIVSSGSWIGREYQGRGLGKEMRAAILHLAFAGLGAEEALSAYYVDNLASQAVSESLGYEPNGRRVDVRRGRPGVQMHVRLPREVWEARRRDDIEIVGLAGCLELFGAATAPARDDGVRPSA